MNFFLYRKQVKRNETTYDYAFSVLTKLINHYGHNKVNNPDRADAILVTVPDPTTIFDLEKMRNEYPDKTIVAGGHLSPNYKLLSIFADMVNVGQGFEFFRCQSLKEARKLDCVYSGREDSVKPSTYINWSIVPVTQVNTRLYYYWRGVGCRNWCHFCYTSWTHKYQLNSKHRVKKAARAIPDGNHITYVSNEYDDRSSHTNVRDMLLTDYIKTPEHNSNFIRMGVEFATEETRNRYAKPITQEQFVRAIEISKHDGEIQFFFIPGLNTFEEWEELLTNVPQDTDFKPRIFCKFTNLEYQLHTPMFRKRHDIKLSRYMGGEDGDELFRKASLVNKRFRFYPVKYPAHAMWRTGLNLCTNKKEYQEFKELKHEKDLQRVHGALHETGVIDNDYSDSVEFDLEPETECQKCQKSGKTSKAMRT